MDPPDGSFCYKIKHGNFKSNGLIDLNITFVNLTEQELPKVEIFVTSESNSDGVIFKEWMDGSELRFIFEKVISEIIFRAIQYVISFQEEWIKNNFWIKLQVKQLHYLEGSNCGSSSYYECFAKQVKLQNSTECIPETMASIGRVDLSEIGFCENDTVGSNIQNYLYNEVYNNLDEDQCPKLCEIEEYSGIIDYEEEKSTADDSNPYLRLYLRYARPYKISVSKEYLIYDLISMIGSVGGTFGIL